MTDPYMRDVGRNIAVVRKRAGLSQDQLAERADLGVKFISRIERGVAVPSLTTMRSLASALQTTVGALALDPQEVDPQIAALLNGRDPIERRRAVLILQSLFASIEAT